MSNKPHPQIAEKAAEDCASRVPNVEEYSAIIQSAIEKAYQQGFDDGRFLAETPDRARSRAAQGSDPPFDQSKHHPSCTPNDQDLMWVCAQCGHKESA